MMQPVSSDSMANLVAFRLLNWADNEMSPESLFQITGVLYEGNSVVVRMENDQVFTLMINQTPEKLWRF